MINLNLVQYVQLVAHVFIIVLLIDEGVDFGDISEVLAFDAGEQEKCVEVQIILDTLVEDDEMFVLNLELITESSRIQLQPFSSSVQIIGKVINMCTHSFVAHTFTASISKVRSSFT